MFLKNLILLCNKNNTTPNAVCLALGLSPAAATKWRSGAVPRETTLLKIADYFNVSVDYLLGKSEQATPKTKAARIPVYGNVAAGIPLEAITDIEDYEEIPADVAEAAEYIALRIHGDSMEPKMSEGDVVIVRIQPEVENGDIAIVMVNGGEATCKRFKKTEEGIILVPINTDYEPIFYSNKQIEELPVKILGKVIELRAKF